MTTQHTKPHYVIHSPVLTEKYTQTSVDTAQGKKRKTQGLESPQRLAFKVDRRATKTQIREALQELYKDIKIQSIRTINCKGKRRRTRFQYGFTQNWKKAVVTLAPGHNIDLI